MALTKDDEKDMERLAETFFAAMIVASKDDRVKTPDDFQPEIAERHVVMAFDMAKIFVQYRSSWRDGDEV